MEMQLSKDHEAFVRASIDAGVYKSLNHIVKEAMEMLINRDAGDPERLAKINEQLRDGLASGFAEGFTIKGP